MQGNPGNDGRDGDDGLDALKVNVGAQVQWHEWDNHLSLNSGYRFDTRYHGHTVDALIVGYRFGESADGRRIKELETLVKEQQDFLKQQSLLNGAMLQQIGTLGQKNGDRQKVTIR